MLVTKIDAYYKKSKAEFDKYGITDNYNIEVFKTPENNNIADVMRDEKQLLRIDYEVAGYYNLINSTWTWGHANPFIEKDITKSVDGLKKLKKVLLETNTKTLDTAHKELYIYFITNPVFFISRENIDKLIKFVIYYTDSKWMLMRKNNTKNPTHLEFILVKNILQIK